MKSLCLVLFLALSTTPACSHFTASGRQERAYAKYLKKSKIDRERRLARFHRDAVKIPPPQTPDLSEPRETTQTSEGPQAIPRDSDNQ